MLSIIIYLTRHTFLPGGTPGLKIDQFRNAWNAAGSPVLHWGNLSIIFGSRPSSTVTQFKDREDYDTVVKNWSVMTTLFESEKMT